MVPRAEGVGACLCLCVVRVGVGVKAADAVLHCIECYPFLGFELNHPPANPRSQVRWSLLELGLR